MQYQLLYSRAYNHYHKNMLLTALLVSILSTSVLGNDDFTTFPSNFNEYLKNFKTSRPIIGLTTMYTGGKKLVKDFKHAQHTYYVAASYVKIVEMAGGRVVPLFAKQSDKELYSLLGSINGAIIAGGDADISDSGYRILSKKIITYAIRKNSEGVHWPVMGICRGAQMLQVAISDKITLITTDAKNYSLSLKLSDDYKQSRMFGFAPEGVISIFQNLPVTMNAHVHGIAPKDFNNVEEVKNFYRILSTNKDRDGKEFISTYEARKYPFYGLQWHPEKPLYVFNPFLIINHSPEAIRVSQYIANFFISEAKLNGHAFKSLDEERRHLIYQWNPVYVGAVKPDTPYEQMYLFHAPEVDREHPKRPHLSEKDKRLLQIISKTYK